MRLHFVRFILALSLSLSPVLADEIDVLFWNVQNEDNWSGYIRDDLKELQEEHDFDIIGLCEVDRDNVQKYVNAVSSVSGVEFESAVSSSGGDFLVVIYGAERFTLKDTIELTIYGGHKMNWQTDDGQWRLRSPFAVQLHDNVSDSDLLVMVNHLKRGGSSNSDRDSQVRGLKAWAADQTLPIRQHRIKEVEGRVRNELS